MPIKISGLKCDVCSWRDDSVSYSEYLANIDRPCPECGANLLTKQEYDLCERMIKKVERVENLIYRFRWLNPIFYWRFIFGDNRKTKTISREFPNRNSNA